MFVMVHESLGPAPSAWVVAQRDAEAVTIPHLQLKNVQRLTKLHPQAVEAERCSVGG